MKKLLLSLLFFAITSNILGQSNIRVRQFAQEYGKELVSKYGTKKATNINTTTQDAEIENNQYVIELETTWDDYEGYLYKDKVNCIVRGVLTTNLDGSNKKFIETFRNDALKKIEEGKNKKETWQPIVEGVGKLIVKEAIKEYNKSTGNSSAVKEYTPITEFGDFYVKEEAMITPNDTFCVDYTFDKVVSVYQIMNDLYTPASYCFTSCPKDKFDKNTEFNNFPSERGKIFKVEIKQLVNYFTIKYMTSSGYEFYKTYILWPRKAYIIQYDKIYSPAVYYLERKSDNETDLVDQPR